MGKYKIRDVILGEGKPKTCLPVVGKTDEDILKIIQSYETKSFDILELRIDFYQDILQFHKVKDLLKKIREITHKPLLFTYRSLKEGGQIQLDYCDYYQLVECACQSHCVDIIDIELMSGNKEVYQLVELVHRYQLCVLMSYHNFHETPSMKELKDKFEMMELLHADILKIAVMPQNRQDVMNLLNITMQMNEKMKQPIITMSMGKLGVISRISGELTGSVLTFASGGIASAPGQISIEDMNYLLDILHND